jgi:phosphate transport system permease protein
LLLGGFFGVAIAIFLTQDFLPPTLEPIFKNIIELLAAIPSVVYGLWGLFVLIPAIRPLANWCYAYLGWLPFFGTSLSGPGLLPCRSGPHDHDSADRLGAVARRLELRATQDP